MQISWLGYSAFRLQSEGNILITDPIDADKNFKINKQSANIVVSSVRGNESADAVSGTPFLITSPGEYETKSIFVYGVLCNGKTIYMITIDSIQIAYIGPVKIKELTEAQMAVLEGADMLIVPVGGGNVCSAKEAVHIINEVEPSIVIPSYYKISGSKGLDSIDAFLKEYSAPRQETEKLKLHKRDLVDEDTKVVILKR